MKCLMTQLTTSAFISCHLCFWNSREWTHFFKRLISKLTRWLRSSGSFTTALMVESTILLVFLYQQIKLARFVFEAAALLRNGNNDEHTAKRVREVYNRCHSMLLEARAAQVQQRLPSSKDIFKGLSLLHPSRVLNQVGRAPLASLPCNAASYQWED